MIYCHHCGKKQSDEAKYCGNCGKEVVSSGKVGADEHGKDSDIDTYAPTNSSYINRFLGLSNKKNFFVAAIWYLLVALSLVPVYLFYPEEDTTLVMDIGDLTVVSIFILAIIVMRNWNLNAKSWVIVGVSGVLAYLFGVLIGTLPIFYILMSENRWDEDEINRLHETELYYIHKLIRKGYIWFIIGAAITTVTYFLAEEGGSFYMFYGAALYGLYVILKGIYYYSLPNAMHRKAADILAEEQKDNS